MKGKLRLVALTLGVASAAFGPAMAADYDPPIFVDEAPDEYVPVEVGSGWYIRGDISYTFSRDFRDSSRAADDTLFDNDFIGLVGIGPLDPVRLEEQMMPVSGSAGFGYHFNDFLRADVTFGVSSTDRFSASGRLSPGYFGTPGSVDWTDPNLTAATGGVPDFGCSGTRTITTTEYDAANVIVDGPNSEVEADWRRDCDVSGQYQASNYDGMANAYVDLGTYVGITPYIGAGLGLVYSKQKFNVSADCQGTTIVDDDREVGVGGTVTETDFDCDSPTSSSSYSETRYDLAYALMAGLSYKMSANTSVDVGYQYRTVPNYEYFTLSNDGLEKRKGIDSHTVKVGLRYDLW
jgi:opacity protein-like surface antigen